MLPLVALVLAVGQPPPLPPDTVAHSGNSAVTLTNPICPVDFSKSMTVKFHVADDTYHAEGKIIYTDTTGMQAEQASRIVERELQDEGLTPARFVTERWLREEERWDDEQDQPDAEEELLGRGYAPWEVRVETESLGDAHDLAEQLREEGYDVSRTFTYVIVGTATREEAVDLAERIHGRVEPGGELVYEVQPQNPFAVFGGLGG